MVKNILKNKAGKITVFTLIFFGVILFLMTTLNFRQGALQRILADDVSTSVQVLNTPPQWDVDAQEQAESSTSNPTNSESDITWVATADDSSGDDYYLLICKTSDAPTANADNPPTCGGGDANEWAVSAAITDEAEATVSTTTGESWAQSNDWYAWICDGHSTLPRCNATYKQGTGNTASPFIVNHRPYFYGYWDDSPKNPGEEVTYYATSSDPDDLGGNDTVYLYVCATANFTAGVGCDDGTWATSTYYYSSDPQATTTLGIPYQDDDYDSYGFVVDNHGHTGTTTQGDNSTTTVSNVAPDFSGETGNIDLYDGDGDPLNLTEPQGTTTFNVSFNVNDNNSCENSLSGDELVSAVANVYLNTTVGQSGCDESGEYDAETCYPGDHPYTELICSQDVGSCTGSSDTQASWTCTTTLWYVAAPTDGASASDSTWWNDIWTVSVQVGDDDTASSSLTETTNGGTELTYFVGYDVSTTSINYGGLEPGQQNDPLDRTSDLIALGNVGLDQELYGDRMCTYWSGADSCFYDSATSSIAVFYQHYASSSEAYASDYAYPLPGSTTTPAELELNIAKTTSTSSPQTKDTYWGIYIPGTITLSGNYSGQDTLTAKRGEADDW